MTIPPTMKMLAIGDDAEWLVCTTGSGVGDADDVGVGLSVSGERSGVEAGETDTVAVGDASVALRIGVL